MWLTRALLTGFEPFGPYPFNPTADLATELDGQVFNNVLIKGIVLPATYHSASELLQQAIAEYAPQRIISLGLASRVPCIRIERIGKNLTNGKYPDNTGLCLESGELEFGGPPTVSVSLNPDALATVLRHAGIRAELSTDPEGFVCNALIYKTMRVLEKTGAEAPSFGFMHCPWTREYAEKINLDPEKSTISELTLKVVAAFALTYPDL